MYAAGMTRKSQRSRKDSDPDQLKRFKEMAREVEVDEGDGAFDRAFGKIVKPARNKPTEKKSDI